MSDRDVVVIHIPGRDAPLRVPVEEFRVILSYASRAIPGSTNLGPAREWARDILGTLR